MNNPGGTAESTADLVVRRKQLSPVFLKRLRPVSETTGSRIVAEVEVGGTPSPNVFWFKDGISITNQQVDQSEEIRLIFWVNEDLQLSKDAKSPKSSRQIKYNIA